MIEMGRVYRTRNGREAVVDAVNRGGNFPVHGAIRCDNGDWAQNCWTAEGCFSRSGPGAMDLIEVKPRIAGWAPVSRVFNTKEEANRYIKDGEFMGAKFLACLEVEFAEG